MRDRNAGGPGGAPRPRPGTRRVAVGLIARGPVAVGVVAVGGIAVGVVAVGGIAVGAVAVGAVAAGAVAVGVLAPALVYSVAAFKVGGAVAALALGALAALPITPRRRSRPRRQPPSARR